MSFPNRFLEKCQDASDTLKEVVFFYVLLVLLSALAFSLAEGLGFWESLYWGGTTTTTTGYGDISPKSLVGRMVALLAMHVSIFVISPLVIARVINYVNRDKHQFTHEEQQDLVNRLERIEQLLQEQKSGSSSLSNAKSGQSATGPIAASHPAHERATAFGEPT